MRRLFDWLLRRADDRSASNRQPHITPHDGPELVIKRVWIDRNECTASTLCVMEAPDHIEMDDKDGVATVKEMTSRTKHDLTQILGAAEVCPMAAFYLETDDGGIFNVEDNHIQNVIKAGKYRWE